MSKENIDLELIRNELRKVGDPWEAGVTSFSSLSFEEQKARLGVTPPPGELSIDDVEMIVSSQKESLKKAALAQVGALTSYDLRNVDGKNFVTPIKDQSNCGSCVAFGTTATVESSMRVQRNDPNLAVDISEAHLFFCHACEDGYNCGSGWWPQKAYDAFKNKGVADEVCYPYNSGLSKRDCSGLCSNWAERVIKITGYTNLTSKPADIKAWVSMKGPVSACFIVYEDFFNYKSGIYKHVSGGQAGGHCVTIVGYNDNPGYWICKNSWGTGWGNGGFFAIAYGECGIESWENHGVDGIANNNRNYKKRIIKLSDNDKNRIGMIVKLKRHTVTVI